ncbi:hypothetical protein [Nonomuraea sp. NPDC049684]|uniref:hypothetical protein n=1 Tax=Nonomuraea sp. NPDC049684 TaxID=3364356 RepID=UPI0037AFFF39
MNAQILPVAGAMKGARCPKVSLTSDGRTLTVTDEARGRSTTLSPASLYRYDYSTDGSGKRSRFLRGVAALDPDGLVLLDLPGDWDPPHLRDFAAKAGIPLRDGRDDSSGRARRILAARAPGWERIRGIPAPRTARWDMALGVCAGIAGLALMVYLGAAGMWGAWRGFSTVGHFLTDLIHAKWLVVAFSPALLVVRPVLGGVHRWQERRGLVVGLPGGPYLRMKSSRTLSVYRRSEVVAELPVEPGSSLLRYRHDDLCGVLLLDPAGNPLLHLPGRWPPASLHRFTERHGLGLAMHRVSREEYLTLTTHSPQAFP